MTSEDIGEGLGLEEGRTGRPWQLLQQLALWA